MPVLSKSSGAFDLPSIITGVVVVGILAAGVLAAIFGVIPFAQDRGAKQDLSSIRTAEGVAKAKDNRFMDHQRLLDIGYLQLSSTEKTKVKADAKGTCYVGIAKSGTGTLFYSTDANTDPSILEADTATGCLTEEELGELIDDVGGIEEDIDNASSLKLVAVSPLEAKATWTAVKGATGYKVEYQVNDGGWTTKTTDSTETQATLSAMPEDTITARVTALRNGDPAEPMLATVKLPDSAFKNPSFELGKEGWTTVGTGSVVTDKARTGTKSLVSNHYTYGATQAVEVPAGTPVLTYWAVGYGRVTVDNIILASTADVTEGAWTKYNVDVSEYTGKTVNLLLSSTNNMGSNGSIKTYIDDVAFEGPKAPSTPLAVSAISRSGAVTANWTGSTFSGGTPVTSYTVSAHLNGEKKANATVEAGLRTAVINGLSIGSDYTLTVTANNATGASVQSAETVPVRILGGTIANPSFELGKEGWTTVGTGSVVTDKARTGTKSLVSNHYAYGATQAVEVPAGTPVLTYWAVGYGRVTVDNIVLASTADVTEGAWTKYNVDVSEYTGKTVNLLLSSTNNMGSNGSIKTYIDDVAFEGPKAPSTPLAVSAISRNGAVTVNWTGSTFSGGTPVTSYTVSAHKDGRMVSSVVVDGDKRSATLDGLSAGSGYTFAVVAASSKGTSPATTFGPIEVVVGSIANPGFEDGGLGWTFGNASYVFVTDEKSRSGSKSLKTTQNSAKGSQAVVVPSDKPVLTYWSTGPVTFSTNDSSRVATKGSENGGWTQYEVDLSAFAGRSVKISFASGGGAVYVDDAAFEVK